MKKGFATSAILYTMLLLFVLLLISILNNLQNKKTILDGLKKDTISALQQDTIIDSILDQITSINNKVVELDTRIANYETNTYTKTEVDQMFDFQILNLEVATTQNELDHILNDVCLSLDNNYVLQRKAVFVKYPGMSFAGGTWVIESACMSPEYGYQIARRYNNDGVVTLERSLSEKQWEEWRKNYGAAFIKTGMVSVNSFVTVENGGYTVMDGNTIVGSIQITVTSSITNNTPIIEGFPAPYINYTGMVYFTGHSDGLIRLGYMANGRIYTTEVLSAQRYGVSFTYIKV